MLLCKNEKKFLKDKSAISGLSGEFFQALPVGNHVDNPQYTA